MFSEHELSFFFLFILLAYVLVYPPREFIAIGLSFEQLCCKFHLLPPIQLDFIAYHRRRTTLNVVLHASLPAIYVLTYNWQFATGDAPNPGAAESLWWSVISYVASILLATAIGTAILWLCYDGHPLNQELLKYSNERRGQSGSGGGGGGGGGGAGAVGWQSVATSINDEYRRPERISARVNTLTEVLATENWVIKTGPWSVRVAHQSDTALIVDKSDTHLIGADVAGQVQFVNIIVKPTRPHVRPFNLRLNAVDFTGLQDRINRPITILNGVNFSRTVVDRFVDAFKECLVGKEIVTTTEQLDSCFACMQAVPNVVLRRTCALTDEQGRPLPADAMCGHCFCRPMWCVDCLAKWFASRQNPDEKEGWLQAKCSCPMCRARFCLVDVFFVEPLAY